VFSDLQSKYPNIIKEEITFFDDGIKNIEMAQSFGIQAFLFRYIE
jgi:FMN phosphatase YigB (HAD superfamily)